MSHHFTDNVAAAQRVMAEYFPHVDFSEVNLRLSAFDFEGAFAAFTAMTLSDYPNILPHPGIIIAAEIRNAQRYFQQEKIHAR
jgi:hypothetical protein